MGLVDDIKREAQSSNKSADDGEAIYTGTETLVIEQALNKLFYAPPNYPEELRMLKMQWQQAQQQGDRYGLHCSAIIKSDNEFCYREQVLSLFYKQAQGENVKIGLKRIFEEGTSIGNKWQRLFIRGGLGVKEHMDISYFNERYDLSYTPDAQVIIAKKDWVVEVKSKNTFQFKKDDSHPSGRKQLRMYMFLRRIRHGFVLVEDKNDQSFKIFPEVYGETFTKDDILPYIERLEAVQVYKKQFIEDKEMVGRKKDCNAASCKRALKCNMRDACWKVGMGRVKLDV